MTGEQAAAMRNAFLAMKRFTKVVELQTGPIGGDGPWVVELWSVNARAGNRNLEVIRNFSDDPKVLALLAKNALGQATKRDQAALSRIANQSAMDAACK